MKQVVLTSVLALMAAASAAAQDIYDAAFVSDASVCEQAGEKPVADLLFETQSWLVLPRQGVFDAEMSCRFYNAQDISGWSDAVPEILATVRCHGYEIDFLDQMVIEADSLGINQSFGDDGIEHKPGEMVEVISMRADTNPPDYENYEGLFSRCEALTEEAKAWIE